MTNVTCRLTAKNRDQLRNPMLGNRVRAIFLSEKFYFFLSVMAMQKLHARTASRISSITRIASTMARPSLLTSAVTLSTQRSFGLRVALVPCSLAKRNWCGSRNNNYNKISKRWTYTATLSPASIN